MGESLTHVQVKGAKKSENEEIMEGYLMQCEKAIERGKREQLPRILQTKLDEKKRERQDKARAKANSPPKPAETAVPTPPLTTTCASASTKAVAITKGKEEGGEEKSQKEQKSDVDEIFPIEM